MDGPVWERVPAAVYLPLRVGAHPPGRKQSRQTGREAGPGRTGDGEEGSAGPEAPGLGSLPLPPPRPPGQSLHFLPPRAVPDLRQLEASAREPRPRLGNRRLPHLCSACPSTQCCEVQAGPPRMLGPAPRVTEGGRREGSFKTTSSHFQSVGGEWRLGWRARGWGRYGKSQEVFPRTQLKGKQRGHRPPLPRGAQATRQHLDPRGVPASPVLSCAPGRQVEEHAHGADTPPAPRLPSRRRKGAGGRAASSPNLPLRGPAGGGARKGAGWDLEGAGWAPTCRAGRRGSREQEGVTSHHRGRMWRGWDRPRDLEGCRG